MKLVSTRGEAPALTFPQALLTGLAHDGGLYLPDAWPRLNEAELSSISHSSYNSVAELVVGKLSGGQIPDDALHSMVASAYAPFRHASTCPLVQIDDNIFVLELFRGPTLAFKDIAMRLLAGMISRELGIAGRNATIVAATSGDTGSAAIDAFGDLPGIRIATLYPHGRVSEVQRRQMTTPDFSNSLALAVNGTFDDCQNLVKAMFAHSSFRDEVALSGINSINWGRIAAQAPYFFTGAASLSGLKRPVSFSVPTGNFGDIFAGFVAMNMGLPVEKLIIATNSNDILTRMLKTGRYEVGKVTATTSPSMDIQVSSNFERLLFEASGRDAALVRRLMASLKQSGGFDLPPGVLSSIRENFEAHTVNNDETADEIARVWRESSYLLDPHTAIGVTAARRTLAHQPETPIIVLGTADPAKFPDAVQAACGVRPALPAHLTDLLERAERMTHVDNDLDIVEHHIVNHRRQGQAATLATLANSDLTNSDKISW